MNSQHLDKNNTKSWRMDFTIPHFQEENARCYHIVHTLKKPLFPALTKTGIYTGVRNIEWRMESDDMFVGRRDLHSFGHACLEIGRHDLNSLRNLSFFLLRLSVYRIVLVFGSFGHQPSWGHLWYVSSVNSDYVDSKRGFRLATVLTCPHRFSDFVYFLSSHDMSTDRWHTKI